MTGLGFCAKISDSELQAFQLPINNGDYCCLDRGVVLPGERRLFDLRDLSD